MLQCQLCLDDQCSLLEFLLLGASPMWVQGSSVMYIELIHLNDMICIKTKMTQFFTFMINNIQFDTLTNRVIFTYWATRINCLGCFQRSKWQKCQKGYICITHWVQTTPSTYWYSGSIIYLFVAKWIKEIGRSILQT